MTTYPPKTDTTYSNRGSLCFPSSRKRCPLLPSSNRSHINASFPTGFEEKSAYYITPDGQCSPLMPSKTRSL